jgi:hypothetical protein
MTGRPHRRRSHPYFSADEQRGAPVGGESLACHPRATMLETPSSTPSAGPPLRCDRCGELLGVYEPLIALEGDALRGTSLAAERTAPAGATYLHRACHLRGGGVLPPEDHGTAA